jgi:hypothetical protein
MPMVFKPLLNPRHKLNMRTRMNAGIESSNPPLRYDHIISLNDNGNGFEITKINGIETRIVKKKEAITVVAAITKTIIDVVESEMDILNNSSTIAGTENIMRE